MTDHIELTFPSGSLSLEGTLTIPHNSPGPAALLISGSGPIDRNSNSHHLASNSMGELATQLAPSGIASLRYDKRGVGSSDGDYLATGFHDNIADAQAALDALRARPEVDPGQIFVIGHSEGAIIASELAADGGLAGVVLLAGTAQNGSDLLTWQTAQIAATLPKPIQYLTKLVCRDLERIQSKRLARIERSHQDAVRIRSAKLNARWLREFMAYEPSNALRRAEVPILAITGSKDLQVDPADINLIGQLVPTPFTGHVVSDLTHVLRKETAPASLRTYKHQAHRPIDQCIATLIGDWIASATCDPKRAEKWPALTHSTTRPRRSS
ncbi:MAG: alpha/beta fold hydrolase [Ornithinimicrobium sp.]